MKAGAILHAVTGHGSRRELTSGQRHEEDRQARDDPHTGTTLVVSLSMDYEQYQMYSFKESQGQRYC